MIEGTIVSSVGCRTQLKQVEKGWPMIYTQASVRTEHSNSYG